MEKLTEPQRDFVRALMTGAGVIDYGNPLAYFHGEHEISPDAFFDVIKRKVPFEDRGALANYYIEAYNAYATEHMFWNLVGELEDWNE